MAEVTTIVKVRRAVRRVLACVAAVSGLLSSGAVAYAQAAEEVVITGGDGFLALGAAVIAIWVIGALLSLVLLILNIWMIIDAVRRQEQRFPAGSRGLWLALLIIGLLLGFGWIAALVYYFIVYKAAGAATAGSSASAAGTGTGFEELSPDAAVDPVATGEPGAVVISEPADTVARKTNLAIIIGAILAFLVVAGLVGAAVFVFVISGSDVDIVIEPVDTPPATAPVGDPELGTPVEPAPVALSTVFTFRDIFDPLIKPLPEESTTTSPTTTPDGGTDGDGNAYPEGTLVLQDIVSVDDGYEAVLVWNGQTYTLAPGERIPDSPWQVQSVSASEAVLLYGDIRVTLAIGSRVIK